jgi:hypothetical protein
MRDLMHAVDTLAVPPTPDLGSTQVSMSLLNQQVSAKYTANAAAAAASAATSNAPTADDGGSGGGGGAGAAAPGATSPVHKRKRLGKIHATDGAADGGGGKNAKGGQAKGMYMGKKKADSIDGQIAQAVSATSCVVICS